LRSETVRIDKCPICGEPLHATVVERVKIEFAGGVLVFLDDEYLDYDEQTAISGTTPVDTETICISCENGHDETQITDFLKQKE